MSSVKAVVRRWQQKQANTYDPVELAEALASGREDLKAIRVYLAKCQKTSALYKTLVGPLMTPDIGTYAARIDQRVVDLVALAHKIEAFMKVAPKAESDWSDLVISIDNDTPSREKVKAVLALDSVRAIQQLGSDIKDLHMQITGEEDKGTIDWTLDDYIGDTCGVYKAIEGVAPNGDELDDLSWEDAPRGYLALLTDPDVINSVD
jgi:hypothetical protein